jgi:hypothetical protein
MLDCSKSVFRLYIIPRGENSLVVLLRRLVIGLLPMPEKNPEIEKLQNV